MMERKLIAEGGIIDYDPSFLLQEEADKLVQYLTANVKWEQKYYTNYKTGDKFPQPRLTAWYADEATMAYSYSGVTQIVQAWLPELLELKKKIEDVTGVNYNSVLLNFYRNGNDSVGSHADDEKELGVDANIASISLGAMRRFLLGCYKQNTNWNREENEDLDNFIPGSDLNYELTNGSLLVMSGTTQHYWKHSIPKMVLTAGQIQAGVAPIGPRINLTFRKFYV